MHINIKYLDWLQEVRIQHPDIWGLDQDAWKEYFDSGLSPVDAWREEFSQCLDM